MRIVRKLLIGKGTIAIFVLIAFAEALLNKGGVGQGSPVYCEFDIIGGGCVLCLGVVLRGLWSTDLDCGTAKYTACLQWVSVLH